MKSKSTIITEPDPSRASSSRFVPPRRDRGALAVAIDVDPAVVCAADDARERRDVLREEREQNGRRSDRDSRIERHLSEDARDGGTREGDDGRRRAFNRAARRRSTASLYSDTIKIETKIVQTTAYASTHMGVGAASSDDAREAMISVDAMCARRRKGKD
jgi:hypothetical protein